MHRPDGSVEMAQSYSRKCLDRTTFLNKPTGKCEPCKTLKGHAVTPNCGHDDTGGRHDIPYKPCQNSTFNDSDSGAVCKPCTVCPTGYEVNSTCTTTSDTQCVLREKTTDVSPTLTGTVLTSPHDSGGVNPQWAVPLVICVSILLVLFVWGMFILKKKGKHGLRLRYRNRPSVVEDGFSPLFTSDGNNDLEQILSPGILSAPLHSVLDNLDVLEQLVILLDPETHGMKNTKHLASHCSFPSTWITYTYSMKESKSPLKAVLEGVTTRHPDWTIRHLAKMLRSMERNDAIAVLTKLQHTSLQNG